MVCGILSITCTGFVGIILGPTALGLGINGRRAIARSNGWKKGDGMATTGIVLGVIGIVLSIVYLIFLVKNPNFITDFVMNSVVAQHVDPVVFGRELGVLKASE